MAAPTPQPDPTTKGLFESKTFWGLVVMILASASQRWFGIDLDEETQVGIATDLGIIAGAVLAIWGRLKASKQIDDLF